MGLLGRGLDMIDSLAQANDAVDFANLLNQSLTDTDAANNDATATLAGIAFGLYMAYRNTPAKLAMLLALLAEEGVSAFLNELPTATELQQPYPEGSLGRDLAERNRKIHERTGEQNDAAKNRPPRIDPLTLDLDGDGIETIGLNANNNVLFDHDGDGAKHGTGWVSADDAMLVLDRNNNGIIDNGRELFGDNTQLANGRFAADGFAALAEMDNNGDGKINADDTQFTNLRFWRDLSEAANSATWLVAA